MRTSGSVDHSRRARLTGAASRGSTWKTAGVSTAATYTNSHPTRTRRMSMAPVCSYHVSAVLYAAIRLRSLPDVRELPERRHAGRPTGTAGRGRPQDKAERVPAVRFTHSSRIETSGLEQFVE